MLDGKEINETAKRFLMNWKASRDARRRQRKQLHFLEGGSSSNFISGSSNALSSIPSLPPIQAPPNSDGRHVFHSGMNPLLYDGTISGDSHVGLPRGTKSLAAIMQARAPNSTLLNRKPAEDVSQSRYWHIGPFVVQCLRNIAGMKPKIINAIIKETVDPKMYFYQSELWSGKRNFSTVSAGCINHIMLRKMYNKVLESEYRNIIFYCNVKFQQSFQVYLP